MCERHVFSLLSNLYKIQTYPSFKKRWHQQELLNYNCLYMHRGKITQWCSLFLRSEIEICLIRHTWAVSALVSLAKLLSATVGEFGCSAFSHSDTILPMAILAILYHSIFLGTNESGKTYVRKSKMHVVCFAILIKPDFLRQQVFFSSCVFFPHFQTLTLCNSKKWNLLRIKFLPPE